MSAYLMISLSTQTFLFLKSPDLAHCESSKVAMDFTYHSQWNNQTGWKNVLNNFRLIIYAKRYPLGQPTHLLWLIVPWLEVFPNSSLLRGLHRLIHTMNQFRPLPLSG